MTQGTRGDSMVDEMEALRDYLLTCDALTYVAGGGIYCEEAPRGASPPFVLLESQGGDAAAMSPLSRPSVRTVCYGRTAKEAKDIDMTLRGIMVDVSDSTGRIVSIAVDEIGEIVVDRDWPEWFCCQSGYSMVVHN